MRTTRCRCIGLAAAALAVGLATPVEPAAAATIQNLSATLDAGNSANQFDDLAQISRLRQSSMSVLVNTASTFTTNYAMVVGTDIGNAATQTVNHTASYTLSFDVLALSGEIWQVDVTSSWMGALTLVNDGSGPATVTLGGVTGAHSGAGTLSGSLALDAVGTLSSNFGGNLPFFDDALGVIVGTGTGGLQAITLNFSWNASSTSTRGGSGSNRGDEGGLRMGIDTAMSSYSADNYPGVGGRTIANDGHRVTVVITTLVPEPEAVLLVALGLLAIEGLGRSRAA
jgi:hypothetical protein